MNAAPSQFRKVRMYLKYSPAFAVKYSPAFAMSDRHSLNPARTPGLGAATTAGNIAAGGAVAGTVGATVFGSSAIMTALFGSAAAGPIGLAVTAGVIAITQVLGLLGVGNGCGQTCVVASNNANEIEQQMKSNLAAFRTGQIDQQTALANFDLLWNAFVQMCHQVGGDQQGNCVSDRQANACKWKDAAGACWNWFSGYRDPIAAVSATAPTISFSSAVASFGFAEWALVGLVGVGVIAAVSE